MELTSLFVCLIRFPLTRRGLARQSLRLALWGPAAVGTFLVVGAAVARRGHSAAVLPFSTQSATHYSRASPRDAVALADIVELSDLQEVSKILGILH